MFKKTDSIISSFKDTDMRIGRLLEKAFRQRELPSSISMVEDPLLSATMFGYKKSKVFNSLNTHEQCKLLKCAEQDLIQEALNIELAGMTYAAKMNLKAQNVQEKQFFCVMAADECEHYQMIKGFFTRHECDGSSFTDQINAIIENSSRQSSLILIQILLEGWGLQHYAKMQKMTQNEAFRGVLRRIIADESRHHGGGLVMFSQDLATESDWSFIYEMVRDLTAKIRIGSWNAAQNLIRVSRINEEKEIFEMLSEIESYQDSTIKLEIVRNLLRDHVPHALLQEMDHQQFFVPFGNEQVAEMMFETLVVQPQSTI